MEASKFAKLERLRRRYVRADQALAIVRQAHIEALGDFLCDRSLTPPDAAAMQQLAELAAAQAAASERYTQCAAAVSLSLVEDIHRHSTGSAGPALKVDQTATSTS